MMFTLLSLLEEFQGAYQQRPVSSIPPIASNGCELPVLGPQAQVSGRDRSLTSITRNLHLDYLLHLPLRARSDPASVSGPARFTRGPSGGCCDF